MLGRGFISCFSLCQRSWSGPEIFLSTLGQVFHIGVVFTGFFRVTSKLKPRHNNDVQMKSGDVFE